MRAAQEAIFPAVVIVGLVIYYLSTLIIGPIPVQASNGPPTDLAQPTLTKLISVQASSTPISLPQTAPASPDSTDCEISKKYPTAVRQWCNLITKYAHENRLEANLIAAMMLQESGGNPRAYSRSGAVGLLQVMPRDGLAASFMCAAGPCFAKRPSMSELYNPEFNIAYGTRMMAGLVQSTGSVREALKSYGPRDMGYRYADIILGIYKNYK